MRNLSATVNEVTRFFEPTSRDCFVGNQCSFGVAQAFYFEATTLGDWRYGVRLFNDGSVTVDASHPEFGRNTVVALKDDWGVGDVVKAVCDHNRMSPDNVTVS